MVHTIIIIIVIIITILLFSAQSYTVLFKTISGDYTVLAFLTQGLFPGSFLHISSAGYAVGYYSYKWTEGSKFALIRFPSFSLVVMLVHPKSLHQN